MNRLEDVTIKRERVKAFLTEHDLSGVLLTRQDSFSWYTSGGHNHVAINTEAGAAALLATLEKDYLVANNIEAPRIMAEEGLEELGIEPVTFQWDAPADTAAVQAQKLMPERQITTDTGMLGGSLKALRYSLTEFEQKRYRTLGADTAEAMSHVCSGIEKGQSEWEIAAALSKAMWERSIAPVVMLVAADERLQNFRHPIPTNATVEKVVMVVVCARRHGLIVSTTRIVHFGPVSEELRRKHNAVAKVDATFIAGTRPGANVSEIFNEALEAYRDTGFPEEWRLHHQGGGTGYATRDFKGTADSSEIVLPGQAFAWNPSIAGTKSEDTIIATDSGPQILSIADGWPMLEVHVGGEAIPRADILVK